MWKFFNCGHDLMTLQSFFGSHTDTHIFCFRISWYNLEFIDLIMNKPSRSWGGKSYWILLCTCQIHKYTVDLCRFVNKDFICKKYLMIYIFPSRVQFHKIFVQFFHRLLQDVNCIRKRGCFSNSSSVILQNYDMTYQIVYMVGLSEQPPIPWLFKCALLSEIWWKYVAYQFKSRLF